MRFKGFWKEYWNLICKPSFTWMRRFWLPYSILLVVTFIAAFCATWSYYFGFDSLKELLFKKRTDEDLEDFLQ